jgi:hypothetical protein
MAEFLNQEPNEKQKFDTDEAFNAMGKPIPSHRKSNAIKHLKEMGMNDMQDITMCIDRVANQLERDEPYKAMLEGMKYLDLVGIYRLFAVLLTA